LHARDDAIHVRNLRAAKSENVRHAGMLLFGGPDGKALNRREYHPESNTSGCDVSAHNEAPSLDSVCPAKATGRLEEKRGWMRNVLLFIGFHRRLFGKGMFKTYGRRPAFEKSV
jgi:hypothetical protein